MTPLIKELQEEARKVAQKDDGLNGLYFIFTKTKLDTLIETIAHRVQEEERIVEKSKAILVMSEFVSNKGENYPLGQYLNMLIALTQDNNTL